MGVSTKKAYDSVKHEAILDTFEELGGTKWKKLIHKIISDFKSGVIFRSRVTKI